MTHADSHDPVLMWQRCLICNQALSAAFAACADMDLGPDSAGKLIEVIRAEASKAIAHGAAS